MAGEDDAGVWADTAEVTVTPSGHVYVWSTYPAEPLVCQDA
jgi:hypothetical protein